MKKPKAAAEKKPKAVKAAKPKAPKAAGRSTTAYCRALLGVR